jgi:hypothetical protein
VSLIALWIACIQAAASKAKRIGLFPLLTGGSWKKSPVTTSYITALSRGVTKNTDTHVYLNASEGFIKLIPPNRTADLIQFVEKFTINHRD